MYADANVGKTSHVHPTVYLMGSKDFDKTDRAFYITNVTPNGVEFEPAGRYGKSFTLSVDDLKLDKYKSRFYKVFYYSIKIILICLRPVL